MGKIKYDIYDNPTQNNGQKRYHVRLAKPNLISYKEVKKMLSKSSSVTPSDVDAVIEGLYGILVDALSNGERVSLGKLGYFGLSVHSPSFNTPNEMNATKIKMRGVNYLPVGELRREVAEKVQFERVEANEHSLDHTRGEIEKKLKDFFKTHESISTTEFRILMNFTAGTAARRLKVLCSDPLPILRHIGNRTSSVYVLTDNGKYSL
jgi:predicted histone-like DNA-binding protein